MTDADDRFTRPTERPPRAPRPDTTKPARTTTYTATATWRSLTDGWCADAIPAATPDELATAVKTLTQKHSTELDFEITTERIDPDGRSYRLNADVRTTTDTKNLQRIAEARAALKHRNQPIQESEVF